MSETTIAEIAQAFDRDADGPSEKVFLNPGFEFTLKAIAERFSDTNDATLWAVALLLIALERGGTCLPLAEIANAPGAEAIPSHLSGQSIIEWEVALSGSAFGVLGSDPKPLLVANDRLYFDRYFQLESAVARQLLTPLDTSAPEATLERPQNWGDICNEVFTDADAPSRKVAEQFFDGRCYVLAGGPGTGKTYTIAKLLAALDRAGVPLSDISLCAPTGKAASRMKDAIQDALTGTRANPETVKKIATSTIHTLLSITPQSFKRKSVTALNTKLVICDETSMVDLALLHELLKSLPPSARIILVGDPNQLQSVDVGSAMLDLIRAHEAGILPGTVLEVVHRVDASMDTVARAELLEFFQEIRTAMSADRAISMLEAGMQAVTYIPYDPENDSEAQVAPALAEAVQRATTLKKLAKGEFDHEAIKSALTSSMVLTAQHEGDLSRTWWIGAISGGAKFRSLRADQLGLPILITASDRANHLTNGDSGLLVASEGGVSFALSEREPSKPISATVLRHFQAWWAMTIHKSQGSEFDNVTVAITPKSRLISKELLYTAITRAKKHVTVIAVEEDLRRAIESPAKRFTGLFEALIEAASKR